MKDFIKYTFATVVGIILAGVIMSIIGVSTMAAMLSMAETETVVPEDAVFQLNLQGVLNERAADNPFAAFLGDSDGEYGLNDILSAIKKAKDNEKIKGIYIQADILSTGYATLQELRRALADFKTSGKFIYVYADAYTQGLYYLTSLADKIMLNPYGSVDWRGISARPVFYKGALDKLDIEMQIFKVGTFKAAVEPFINDKMSDANREQVTAYTSEIWDQILQAVSESRHLSKERLNELADAGNGLEAGELFVKSQMVDTLIYKNDVREVLKQKLGKSKDDKLKTLSLKDMINIKRHVPKDKSGDVIAVYYAYGSIVDSGVSSTINPIDEIVGDKVAADLKKLKDDENVKAVVFRVNSRGGSAFASEIIWQAVQELKAEKPVIVSMGDYAASGGYYISAGADYILAEPTTLTGSIGIFARIPNIDKLYTKLGITFDDVKTNKHADFATSFKTVPIRGFTDDEKRLIQTHVNRGYETFVGRCAEGRKMSTDAIKAIAEGRVWTGLKAKELGLVDELGGIDRAIELAVERAKIGSYTLMSYPKQKSFVQSLLDGGFSASISTYVQKRELGDLYPTFKLLQNLRQANPIQARLPYHIEVY